MSDYSSAQNQPISDNNLIWHALRIENKTNTPWTTAPVVIMNNGIPISQSDLKYTPSSAKSIIKMSIAADVQTNQSLIETSRKPISNNYGFSYLITADGSLTITNWKNQEIQIIITKKLSGEVTDASIGKVVKNITGLSNLNPESEISWDIILKPGEKKELKYTVQIYK